MKEHSPRRLEVGQQRDPSQEDSVFRKNLLKVGSNKIGMAQRSSQHTDPSLLGPPPRQTLTSRLSGLFSLPPEFHVHLDAGMFPQSLTDCSVYGPNPVWSNDNPYVIQKREESFAGFESTLDCMEGCWPRENKSGIKASPCSLPPPCSIVLTPLSLSHRWLEGLLYRPLLDTPLEWSWSPAGKFPNRTQKKAGFPDREEGCQRN